MKLQKIILLFLTIALLGCTKENGEITINGKINGLIPEKVEYTTPINGKWFYGDKKSITTDSIGAFQIKMDIKKPSFVTIYVSGKSGILLVEPNKTYDVKFEFKANQKKIRIVSKDSIGQNYYNTFPPPDLDILGINTFLKDSIPLEISSKINNLKEKEVSKFDKLLEDGEISSGFYELAVLDRKSYYLALEANVANIMLFQNYNNKNRNESNNIVEFWNTKIEPLKLNEFEYIRSPWFYALSKNLISFNQILSADFDLQQLRKKYKSGEIYKYNIAEAEKYLKGEQLEYYLSSYIFYESWQTKDNSKKIIEIYEYFKKEYPKSDYTKYLTNSVQQIIDYQNKIAETTSNDKIQLIENYENIDTFDELIKTLKGKKVFVDIWGTWCGPCKREFQQKDKYTELLKSKNITTLYICEGKNSKEKIWKEMIKFYDLEGQHILANENLVSDIIDRFGNNGSFAYPWYLLVDEKGNVVNKRASYPSKTEQLKKEINKNYVW
jgi:thiol-disulfide isomerase/thioredoxin